MDEIILKGRLKGYQRMRLASLLNMLYKPSELAEEIGFTTRQVYRVYVPAGCPHERDTKRNIWINGFDFAAWYEATYIGPTLDDGEAFCLTCKKAVKMKSPEKRKKGKLSYWLCDCPNCGRRLARIIDKDMQG